MSGTADADSDGTKHIELEKRRGGVLVVDKPSGKTSHDIVAVMRKQLGTRAVGHAGTLDPMATGVLVIAFDAGTKLVPYLTAADKTYEATVRLGIETHSLDADGDVVREAPLPSDWPRRLPSVLEDERTRSEQTPPAVSAIHVDGKRAYERARRGESVELPPRPVAVRELTLLGTSEDSFTVRLTVSKGYYVRSFARDAAHALGTVGHLTKLRRIASGAFTLDDVDQLLTLEDAARRALPIARLSARGVEDARVGRPVAPEDISGVDSDAVHAWLDDRGLLVAVGEHRPPKHYVVRGF